MKMTIQMCVAVAALLLTLAAQGRDRPISQPNALSTGRSNQSENQNASLQSLTRPPTQQIASPTTQQQTQGQSGAPSTRSTSPSTEPKESFSQLTLFLFASGLALFIALLGWGDQIRGIDRDTRKLERRFLQDTGIDERDFLRLVKPGSADEQLEALTQAVNDARIKTKVSAEVLRTFATYIRRWSRIERLSAWKYNLTITLAISLFVAGIASLFTTPTQQVRLLVSVRAEMVILILPMTIIGLLIVIIICNLHQEKAFFLMRLHSSRASLEAEEIARPKELPLDTRRRLARSRKLPVHALDEVTTSKKLPPDARETLGGFFAVILLNVMHGMIKADSVEPKFTKIREAAKSLTKEEMRRVSVLAGKYYAEHANPSPKRLSKEQVENLKREALEFALKAAGN